MLQFLLLDELLIQILEFLQAVIVFEQLLYRTLLAIKEFLDGCAALAPIARPKGAVQKSMLDSLTGKEYPPKLSMFLL